MLGGPPLARRLAAFAAGGGGGRLGGSGVASNFGRGLLAWAVCGAGEDAFFRDGYDQVTRYVARRLRIDTGVVVRRVALRRRGVEVHTSAGTIVAQAVVVTVPLGVLKAQAITFEPGLPVRHEQAIDRLGMGVLSKTFLRFDEPFWPVHQDWQEYLGPRRGAWAE